MPSGRLALDIPSEEALESIEETAHRLLAEVGIFLQHAGAMEILHGLGCGIKGGRVFIPRDTIQWTLDNVTPHRQFFGRDGTKAFELGDRLLRFHSGGLPFVFDLDNGERRLPLVRDVADATRLLDALPNEDVIIPLIGPQDVLPELLAVASTDAMLRNTRKPVWSAPIDRPEDVRYMVEMVAARCRGMEAFRSRPTMYLSVSPVSPLVFSEKVTAAIMAVAQSGAPFLPLPAPSLGATGPVTMAGALAQQHAESLVSLLIAAAARPGVPVMYCSRINAIDPKTVVSTWGAPEVGMTGACAAQLAHRLGFPCDSYGLSCTSRLLDPEFAYERLANALVPALAGVDILSGVVNGGGLIAGFEIAVIDYEIISLIKKIVAGCVVSETTLAYDLMREVIPREGVFLGEMHTVKQMRQAALWIPGISRRGEGEADHPGVVAREILTSHQAEALPEEVGRRIDETLARAPRTSGGLNRGSGGSGRR